MSNQNQNPNFKLGLFSMWSSWHGYVKYATHQRETTRAPLDDKHQRNRGQRMILAISDIFEDT